MPRLRPGDGPLRMHQGRDLHGQEVPGLQPAEAVLVPEVTERTPCQEYGHDFEEVASWPSGPSETTVLLWCRDCGDEYETSMEEL